MGWIGQMWSRQEERKGKDRMGSVVKNIKGINEKKNTLSGRYMQNTNYMLRIQQNNEITVF